jgi:hypothetical protein
MRATMRRRSPLRSTQSGHAMTEAVIMIPVFAIIWGAIAYMSIGFETKLDLSARVRQEAWAHAMDNCDGSSPPAPTRTTDATRPTIGPLADLFSAIDSILELMRPLLADWPGLFPEERRFDSDRVVDKPAVLGGGSATARYEIVLMCNEAPRDVDLDSLGGAAWDFIDF